MNLPYVLLGNRICTVFRHVMFTPTSECSAIASDFFKLPVTKKYSRSQLARKCSCAFPRCGWVWWCARTLSLGGEGPATCPQPHQTLAVYLLIRAARRLFHFAALFLGEGGGGVLGGKKYVENQDIC